MIVFEKRGMLTTIQDGGRLGYQRFGMPTAGAMDPFALALANILVGNPPETEAIEATILGPTIRFETDAVFAVSGGDLQPRLNGDHLLNNKAYLAKAGSLLEMPIAKSGARAYIAIAGGLDAELVMGSRSTCIKAGIGGIQGRAVQDGDRLGLRAPKKTLPGLSRREVPEDFGVAYSSHPTVRFTFGPQDDAFTEVGKQTFSHGEYTLTPENDRMGFRFQGPAVEAAPGSNGNIISDGICFGSIQIPKELPIVMMADHQTTGGYAKLGCVIRADLPLLAQLKAGDTVRFQPVTVEEAQSIYLAQRQLLLDLAERLARSGAAGTRSFRVTVNGRSFDVELEQVKD